jgi:phosphonate transport system substrate-binding protein
MRRADNAFIELLIYNPGKRINASATIPRDPPSAVAAKTRRQRSTTIVSILCWFAMFAAQAQEPAPPPRPYVFGAFPYLPQNELENLFAPIAADFNRALGREVQFMSKTSFESFSSALAGEQLYDIAFVQPFDYVRAAGRSQYLPLAARPEKLYALIVTTSDSPIRNVADLKGKRISLPPKDAAISRLIRVYLRKHGLVPGKNVEFVYLRSHTSCLQHVLIGLIDACGTTPSAMHHLKNSSRERLRGIAETDAIPPALFVVHSRVPESERKLILKAILAWPKKQEGIDIQLSGFAPIADADYDVVRKFPVD